ncbi:hypothetical protein L3X38_028125 [Prunus dulcis]|uniref:Uncharacterized protein n=1 Tax=Prunus dulcis TaxID=3755 RepID=A0AAD4VPD0_PRUDU|nr:hypothetical protein L3X38_028125 [Prunus dulcis]
MGFEALGRHFLSGLKVEFVVTMGDFRTICIHRTCETPTTITATLTQTNPAHAQWYQQDQLIVSYITSTLPSIPTVVVAAVAGAVTTVVAGATSLLTGVTSGMAPSSPNGLINSGLFLLQVLDLMQLAFLSHPWAPFAASSKHFARPNLAPGVLGTT